MKIILQILKKISFSLIFLLFIIYAYFSLKKEIKKKLSGDDFVKITQNLNNFSKHKNESLLILRQIISKEALSNFLTLKDVNNKQYFINKTIRTDKIKNYNNHLFCKDEVIFAIKQNKNYFENEKYKEFKVNFGYFTAIKDFEDLDESLTQLELNETGGFIYTNKKKTKSYTLQLISVNRKSQYRQDWNYFWFQSLQKNEKFKCFDIVKCNIKIKDAEQNVFFEDVLRFNIGEDFLPNWIERIILSNEKGNFTFLLNEKILKEDSGLFFSDFFKNKKNINFLKEQKILFFDIIF